MGDDDRIKVVCVLERRDRLSARPGWSDCIRVSDGRDVLLNAGSDGRGGDINGGRGQHDIEALVWSAIDSPGAPVG